MTRLGTRLPLVLGLVTGLLGSLAAARTEGSLHAISPPSEEALGEAERRLRLLREEYVSRPGDLETLKALITNLEEVWQLRLQLAFFGGEQPGGETEAEAQARFEEAQERYVELEAARRGEVRELLAWWRELEPDSFEPVQADAQLAATRDESLAILHAFLAEHADSLAAATAVAELLFRDDESGAIDFFEGRFKAHREDPRAWQTLISLYERAEGEGQARSLRAEWMDRFPEITAVLLERLERLLELAGTEDEVVGITERLLTRPVELHDLIGLCQLLGFAETRDLAIRCYGRVLDAGVEEELDAYVRETLTALHLQAGSISEAKRTYFGRDSSPTADRSWSFVTLLAEAGHCEAVLAESEALEQAGEPLSLEGARALGGCGEVPRAAETLRSALAEAAADEASYLVRSFTDHPAVLRAADAEAILSRRLAIEPEAEDLYAATAALYRSLGDEERKLSTLLLWHSALPEDAGVARKLAKELEEWGRLEAALEISRHAATLQPESFDAQKEVVDLLLRMGDEEGAVAAADELAGSSLPEVRAFGARLRGRIAHHQRRYEEAVEHYGRAEAGVAPERFFEFQDEYATALRDAGRLEDLDAFLAHCAAESLGTAAWEEDPNAFLAEAYEELGLPERALAYRATLAAEHGESPGAWRKHAEALAALGRTAEAERSFRRALDLDPADAEAAGGLAMLLLRAERHAAVREVLEAVIPLARRAEMAELQRLLARAHGGLGELEAAVRVLRAALAHDGSNHLASLELGEALEAAGRGRAAHQQYDAFLAATEELASKSGTCACDCEVVTARQALVERRSAEAD